jgi:hypothetical protein
MGEPAAAPARSSKGREPFTHPDYEKLPEGVKMCMTEKEYCWLSDSEKLTIVDQYTMPEVVED